MSKLMTFRNTPGSTISLGVTQTSSFTALAVAAGEDLLITNSGTKLCYVNIGAESVLATTASLPILAASAFVTRRDQLRDLYFAAICDSGETTTLKVTVGTGS